VEASTASGPRGVALSSASALLSPSFIPTSMPRFCLLSALATALLLHLAAASPATVGERTANLTARYDHSGIGLHGQPEAAGTWTPYDTVVAIHGELRSLKGVAGCELTGLASQLDVGLWPGR
jgi:hypothetical protein